MSAGVYGCLRCSSSSSSSGSSVRGCLRVSAGVYGCLRCSSSSSGSSDSSGSSVCKCLNYKLKNFHQKLTLAGPTRIYLLST